MSVESQPFDYAATGLLVRPSWRLIPQIDRDPRLVAGVQGFRGRLLLCCAVALLAVLLSLVGIDFSAAGLAMMCAYAGRHRRVLILLATLLLLFRSGFLIDRAFLERLAIDEGVADRIHQPLLEAAMLVVVFALFSCLLAMQGSAGIGLRRPTLSLLLVFLALVVATQATVMAGMPRVLLWSFLMAAQPYLWFLAYGLADAGKIRSPVWQRLSVFHPFWGSTLTPFGKGLSYLERFEAKTPEELAVTQLKGVKLAAWTLVLAIVKICFGELIHDHLQLPLFDDNLLQYLAGHPWPRLVGWASLVSFFVEDLLGMTVFGGIIVATARLAGFACCATPTGLWSQPHSPNSGIAITSTTRNCSSITSSTRPLFDVSAAIAGFECSSPPSLPLVSATCCFTSFATFISSATWAFGGLWSVSNRMRSTRLSWQSA